jgi:hypothetical protein
MSTASAADIQFELRFATRLVPDGGFAIPCDSAGRVDLAHLPEQAGANYAYARSAVGTEFFSPTIFMARRRTICETDTAS